MNDELVISSNWDLFFSVQQNIIYFYNYLFTLAVPNRKSKLV